MEKDNDGLCFGINKGNLAIAISHSGRSIKDASVEFAIEIGRDLTHFFGIEKRRSEAGLGVPVFNGFFNTSGSPAFRPSAAWFEIVDALTLGKSARSDREGQGSKYDFEDRERTLGVCHDFGMIQVWDLRHRAFFSIWRRKSVAAPVARDVKGP